MKVYINWHGQHQTYMNRTFIGTIRTGQTQAISNWLTSLAITNRLHLRGELDDALDAAASKGEELQANIPECDVIELGGRQFAVVYGVKSKGVTPRGREHGEFLFVVCFADDPDERLLVTEELFQVSKRLRRIKTA